MTNVTPLRPNHQQAPVITVDHDETRVVDEAISHLANCQNTFQRGGMLVQIVHEERTEKSKIARPVRAPSILMLRDPTIRERLADAAIWMEVRESGATKQIHPPPWAVMAVQARGQWKGVPALEGVVETPVLRDDGTILDRPGYDKQTGLFFDPTDKFLPTPLEPTREDAVRSVAMLLDVVHDFPFSSDVHRSAWLAAVLTPFVRHAFHGPAPLFLIDASTPGTGKTLLAHVTGAICAGRGMACTPKPETDEEWGKVITTIALEGDRLVLVDNCTGALGGSRIDAALTSTEWSDRILGANSRPKLPLAAIWYATGNNVQIRGDTARRTLHIRLDATVERPENREDFRHPDLLDWVRHNRAELVQAALIILRAWQRAGRPGSVRSWGSYEAWSSIVRRALVWAGQPDPYEATKDLMATADEDAAVLTMAIDAVAALQGSGTGVTASEMHKRIRDMPPPALLTFVQEGLGGSQDKPPTALVIGKRLAKYKGRWSGQRRLETAPQKAHGGAPLWRVGP